MANEKENKSVTVSSLGEALKSPRSKRFGLWLAVIIVLFGLFGFFAAPSLAKSLLLKELSVQLQIELYRRWKPRARTVPGCRSAPRSRWADPRHLPPPARWRGTLLPRH